MKKIWLLMFVLLFAIVACGSDESAADESTTTDNNNQTENEANTSTNDVTVVRFAVSDFELGTYTDLIEAFEDENPTIKIELVSVDSVLGTDGADTVDGGLKLAQAADVLTTNNPLGNREITLRDLSPFIDSDSSVNADDFYAGAIPANDTVRVLPTTLDYFVVYYDQELFDAAGVAYPEPGWTWDDMRANAIALTDTSGDDIQWGLVPNNPTPLFVVSGLVDQPLVNTAVDPAEPRFEDDDVVAAVDWYTSLVLDDKVVAVQDQDNDGPGAFRRFDLIESGNVAMFIDTAAGGGFLRRNDTIASVPFPVGSDNANTSPVLVTGLAMSAGTNKPNEAWAWMSFLSQQEQPGFFFGGGGDLPARISIAESVGFWDDIDDNRAATLSYATQHALELPESDAYSAFLDAITSIINDGTDVKTALATAQADGEAEIETAQSDVDSAESFAVIESDGADEAILNATTIDFVVAGAFDIEAYRDVADAFAAANPGVRVQVRLPDFSGRNFGFATIAQEADCFFGPVQLQDQDFLAQLLVLDPFVDADASMSLSDFYPALLSEVQIQGQLWGIPAELNPTIIEYNRAVFDEAGVDYPSADWTVDQFLDTAIALTSGDGDFKNFGFVPDAFELTTLLLMMERQGAVLIDESVDPPSMAFTSPSTIEAMRWYAGLSKELEIKPNFVTDPSAISGPGFFLDREGMIDEGRAGMWTTFGAQARGGGRGAGPGLGSLGDRSQMDIGIAPLPLGSAGGGGFTSANAYYISNQTEFRRECWDWISFVSQSPDVVSGLPARESIAESAEYEQRVGSESAAAYRASIRDAEGSSVFQFFGNQTGWMGTSIFWLGRAHTDIVDNEMTVEDALGNAQASFDAYRDCIVERDGTVDEDVQEACLDEVDPTFNGFFGRAGGGGGN